MRTFWNMWLRLMGWRTDLSFPYHHVKKYVAIVGPHTSGWDFIIGVAYRSLLGMERVKFLGKEELFRPPFGFIFRWLGGTPVNRKSSQNMVDEVVKLFDAHDEFALALSPEGTRQKVDKLRSGFYHIAKQAHVPIIMIGLDFGNKQVVFHEPVYTTEDQAQDFEKIVAFFRHIRGKFPEKGLMHF
ncbi:MAG: 1-acyl-sn-glycerol-3-phosphate acyltransferase [Cyclobacteriaceae bacterium]|nr:1-acyl-sn-glycerol-3-phosphate acyltransferase [Cyclobacteriaceae bacterium]